MTMRPTRDNDRPAAGSTLDVERLGIDISDNSAAKVRVARQSSGVIGGKPGVDIQAVAGEVVVVLGDVDGSVAGAIPHQDREKTTRDKLC